MPKAVVLQVWYWAIVVDKFLQCAWSLPLCSKAKFPVVFVLFLNKLELFLKVSWVASEQLGQ